MANRGIVDIILQETPEHNLTVSNRGGKGKICFLGDFGVKAAYSAFNC